MQQLYFQLSTHFGCKTIFWGKNYNAGAQKNKQNTSAPSDVLSTQKV